MGGGLKFGFVEEPGVDLTLTDNNFDGTRYGALLNNIKGPFTLSHTNSFLGTGQGGGWPVWISGVDVTVDDWIATTPANTLGIAGAGSGIIVGKRDRQFAGDLFSEGIIIRNNKIHLASIPVQMSLTRSATIDGNDLDGSGHYTWSALSISQVPGNSTYSITNNKLFSSDGGGAEVRLCRGARLGPDAHRQQLRRNQIWRLAEQH